MLLADIGEHGQAKLHASVAVVAGVGALGCVAAELLTRAGVGTIVLIDRDLVDATNLQRQVLYTEEDAARGTPKAHAAAARLASINSSVKIVPLAIDLTGASVSRAIGTAGRPDVLLDGTDNFETRYLLNDVSVRDRVPLCYAGVIGTVGMHATFMPGGACLRCMFDDPPEPGSQPTCDTAGVLGASVAAAASMQVADAMKILLGRNDRLSGMLERFDAWTNGRQRIRLVKRDACVCCGAGKYEFLSRAVSGGGAALCGQDAVQVWPAGRANVDLGELATRLHRVVQVRSTPFMLRATVPSGAELLELTVFEDGRAIIRGTRATDVARAIYAKYVGA